MTAPSTHDTQQAAHLRHALAATLADAQTTRRGTASARQAPQWAVQAVPAPNPGSWPGGWHARLSTRRAV